MTIIELGLAACGSWTEPKGPKGKIFSLMVLTIRKGIGGGGGSSSSSSSSSSSGSNNNMTSSKSDNKQNGSGIGTCRNRISSSAGLKSCETIYP